MNKQTFNSKGLISLWQSACDGNQDCLAKLFTALQDPIFRYCCAQLGDQGLAAEATQETALRMLRSLNQFEGRSQITSWAIGFAVNVCREIERDKTRWQKIELDVLQNEMDALRTTDELEKPDSFSRLRLFVTELAPRQREAIVLKYFEEMPIKQVAEVMQVSMGTVKATLNQAVANLRRIMRFKS